MKYYVIRNDAIVATLDTGLGDVIAFPVIKGSDAMSLMDSRHAANLMTNLSLTAAQALAALGVTDLRASTIKTIFISPNLVSLHTPLHGAAYRLLDIGAYTLWQVDTQADNILALHAELYATSPVNTLGALAVVQTFGSAFYASAVMTYAGMTAAQALARRNRIATYLDSLGKNTTTLRATTTEHTQMLAIAAAMGFTTAQMWAKMVV